MIFILLLKCPDLKYKSLSYNAGLRLRELADSEAVLRAVLLGAAQTSSRRAGAGKSTDPPPPPRLPLVHRVNQESPSSLWVCSSSPTVKGPDPLLLCRAVSFKRAIRDPGSAPALTQLCALAYLLKHRLSSDSSTSLTTPSPLPTSSGKGRELDDCAKTCFPPFHHFRILLSLIKTLASTVK